MPSLYQWKSVKYCTFNLGTNILNNHFNLSRKGLSWLSGNRLNTLCLLPLWILIHITYSFSSTSVLYKSTLEGQSNQQIFAQISTEIHQNATKYVVYIFQCKKFRKYLFSPMVSLKNRLIHRNAEILWKWWQEWAPFMTQVLLSNTMTEHSISSASKPYILLFWIYVK